MEFNRDRLNRHFVVVTAIVLALIVTYSGYRALRHSAGKFFGDFFYPYLAVARFAEDKISNHSLLGFSRLELASQVEKLMAINRALATEASAARAFQDENLQLRQLLDLSPPTSWRYIAAEVILRDPVLWNEHFTINRGSRYGLKTGAAVISVTPDGRPILVGILDSVKEHSSEVRTLFSPGLRLSAVLGTSGAVGLVNAGDRQPTVDSVPIGYLPSNVSYTPQEALFTTGYEYGIPPGIKIGEIVTVEEVNSRYSSVLRLSGLLKPASQLNSIRFLLVANRIESLAEGRK